MYKIQPVKVAYMKPINLKLCAPFKINIQNPVKPVFDFSVLQSVPYHIRISPIFKGSDWLCKVAELSMQCCGQLLSDSFETY